jgi:DNA-binding CsgD family transcriptional regulator
VTPLATLSPREAKVCGLVAAAHPTKAVADELHISPRTVENYRARIMKKLNLHSVVEMTHWALAHGLARNLFLVAVFGLLLSPSEAFPDSGSVNVRETAGHTSPGRAVAAAPPQPKAEQQLRPTDPNDEMHAAIMRRREVVVTNAFTVLPVVKFHRAEIRSQKPEVLATNRTSLNRELSTAWLQAVAGGQARAVEGKTK